METSSILSGNLHATVKSREIQRAMLAEMAGDPPTAIRHYLAAAHLELVLAEDYKQMGNTELMIRSRFSAASCFWKAGQIEQARSLFAALSAEAPETAEEIQEVLAELSLHGSTK